MVVAAGVAFALATSSARSGGSGPGLFSTIPTGKLAAGGITLTAPHGSTPSAAAGRAAARAAGRAFGEKLLEYHYAYCSDTQHVPPLAQDCWAVSLDPSGHGGGGAPQTGPPSAATYLFVLVDPSTDAVIEGQSD